VRSPPVGRKFVVFVQLLDASRKRPDGYIDVQAATLDFAESPALTTVRPSTGS
jgi:hypothetical protein